MSPFAEATQLALKGAIAASGEARRCSERLAGKSIAVESFGQRLVVCFEAGGVRVEADDREADATVRGSPLALLLAAVEPEWDSSAVFGDADIVADFRASFRPHLHATGVATLAEDAGDALRLGVKAAHSALEGVVRSMGGIAPDDDAETASDAWRTELAAVKEQLQRIEERLRALETRAENSEDE